VLSSSLEPPVFVTNGAGFEATAPTSGANGADFGRPPVRVGAPSQVTVMNLRGS
jgi:hypothetical protein